MGYEFRRQRPVLNFIADFMCFELKLVIELDGITHHWDETVEKDRRKDDALREAGFTVLRFTDEEVLRNMKEVIQQIEFWIEAKVAAERLVEEDGLALPAGKTSPLPPSEGG